MPANPLPLSERIHNLCPTRTLDVSNYGEFCGHDDDGPAFCKWEGHAIAGEVASMPLSKVVAALTAKVEEGHTRSCVCLYGDEYVDPRCVEWRKS